MHSIQAKSTLLTALGIIITILVATVISAISISTLGNENSKQILSLLCETGQKNLDYYFDSVQDSVDLISRNVTRNIQENGKDHLNDNIDYCEKMFASLITKTNGALDYYYRIDPEFDNTELGFWYIDYDDDDQGFVEHAPSPINSDNINDPGMVWFAYPKTHGTSRWIAQSYVTANLPNYKVISYNSPVFLDNTFVGVVGIEIDFKTITKQVDNIELYNGKGYAFINDDEGNIIYHPNTTSTPKVPDGLLSQDSFISYSYDGKDRIAVWANLKLKDGDHNVRLNVSVPVSEISGNWQRVIIEIVIAASVILIVFIMLTIIFTRHITKPLRKLTEAAEEINDGNYNVKLDYRGNDEVGVLSTTVNKLIEHLRGYIADLNSLAYVDALTEVRNKGAFDIFVRQLQARIDDRNDRPEFAIGIFDSDDLKEVNDEFGHEKGDVYLKNACHLICRVFTRSPVFRIGGDEFAVILQGEDYYRRESLRRFFIEKSAEICAFASEPWEKICMAVGIAVYNSGEDKTVEDVIRHADQLMYENKRERKKEKNN